MDLKTKSWNLILKVLENEIGHNLKGYSVINSHHFKLDINYSKLRILQLDIKKNEQFDF